MWPSLVVCISLVNVTRQERPLQALGEQISQAIHKKLEGHDL